MADSIEKIVDKLKELINDNGPSYLSDDPYKAFIELTECGVSGRRTASAILCFLANGMLANVSSDSDLENLSKQTRKECGFNKKTADMLAMIFLSVFSADNEEAWREKNLEGWNQFLNDELALTWKGFSVWDYGTGTVSCHYEAEIILMPTDHTVVDRTLARALEKNPFMSKEHISEHYRKQLKKYLDYEFQYYCTCDDYYQPCVEDFMVDRDAVRTWCEENGFELIACEGDGYDGGYEPKLWNGGW